MSFCHFDVSNSIVCYIKKAISHVLHVQEDEVTVLQQGKWSWLVEVAKMPKVIINVLSNIFDDGVLMIFVSSPDVSYQGIVDLKTTQYEVSCLNTPNPAVRVVE